MPYKNRIWYQSQVIGGWYHMKGATHRNDGSKKIHYFISSFKPLCGLPLDVDCGLKPYPDVSERKKCGVCKNVLTTYKDLNNRPEIYFPPHICKKEDDCDECRNYINAF